jgi:polysaccharide pyruvyl transferase WcaK-like protein
VVTDSTLRHSNARLHRMARALGARILPLRARPQRAGLARQSRFALKRLAGHLAPPGLWRDRWHGLIPDFDAWTAWVAENAGLLVAGRFHGLCMALAMRIPAVALASNTWKVEGVLERAGLRHRLVADVDALERRLMAEGIAPFAYTASEQASITALQREAGNGARAMLRDIVARSRVAAKPARPPPSPVGR